MSVLSSRRGCARRALAVLALAGAATLVCGCGGGSDRLPVYPVQGQLYFDNKPAHKAIIWLHPEGEVPGDSKGPSASPRPHARVGPDGSFAVSTYETGDGAPVGRYRISVIWNKDGPGGGDNDGASLLPPRYLNPRTADLPVIEVKAGPNVLPPLRLSP